MMESEMLPISSHPYLQFVELYFLWLDRFSEVNDLLEETWQQNTRFSQC